MSRKEGEEEEEETTEEEEDKETQECSKAKSATYAMLLGTDPDSQHGESGRVYS